MSLLAMSVSHKTASIDVLAGLALDEAGIGALTARLIEHPDIGEALVLSTCNRTELYVSTERFHAGVAVLADEVAGILQLDKEVLPDLCAVYFENAAVAHCFRVVAGLDSMVVGESQILGQIRTAFSRAQRLGAVGTDLQSLFQQALRLGKQVQTDTAVGGAGRSLVTAAFDALERDDAAVEGQRVLVVGAGAMASLAVKTAAGRGARVTCVNRTYDKAHHLATQVGGRAATLERLHDELRVTDVLVTSTGARGVLIGPGALGGTPVRAAVDLALPGDIDTGVRAGGVHLVNLASLADDSHAAGDPTAVAAAEQLVAHAVERHLATRRALAVAPTVVALRSMARDIVAAEMRRLEGRVPHLDAGALTEIRRSLDRVSDKFLHQPTVRVQQGASGEHEIDYAAVLRELFALDQNAVDAVEGCPR